MISLQQQTSEQINGNVGGARVVLIHDPVHGPMELLPCQLELLRTPHFQRLTRLKQLGVAYLVFPGATHTRAEHSLGVAWLARLLVQSLRVHQPDIELSERDERLLVLAAQAHDLGHGVASHAFEGWLHRSPFAHQDQSRGEWKHEAASVRILRDAVERGLLPSLSGDEHGLERIEAFILGKVPPTRVLPRRQRWMLDVVNNVRSGIDVDRLDYLQRDALHALGGNGCGLMHIGRLLCNARVSSDGCRLLFHVKTLGQLNELFHRRWSMFRMIYGHDTVLAIEMMLHDFFEHLVRSRHCTVLRDALQIGTIERYMLLDDSLLQHARLIWHSLQKDQQTTTTTTATTATTATTVPTLFGCASDNGDDADDDSGDPSLQGACQVLREIEARRLYDCIARRTVPSTAWRRVTQRQAPNVGAIIACIKDADLRRRIAEKSNCFRINAMCFHYGGGDRNPLDQVRFFDWNKPDTPVALSSREHSRLMPRHWSEIVVRLYCRPTESCSAYTQHEQDQCVVLCEAMRSAFDVWLDSLLLSDTGAIAVDNGAESVRSPAEAVMRGGDSSCRERHAKKRRRDDSARSTDLDV